MGKLLPTINFPKKYIYINIYVSNYIKAREQRTCVFTPVRGKTVSAPLVLVTSVSLILSAVSLLDLRICSSHQVRLMSAESILLVSSSFFTHNTVVIE